MAPIVSRIGLSFGIVVSRSYEPILRESDISNPDSEKQFRRLREILFSAQHHRLGESYAPEAIIVAQGFFTPDPSGQAGREAPEGGQAMDNPC
jgi:hypothetical protein